MWMSSQHSFLSNDDKNSAQLHSAQHRLPITLDPEDDQIFRDALLKTRRELITLHFADGRTEMRPWRASSFRETSSVMRNLRSRQEFRQGTWQRARMVRVHVSVEPMGAEKLR